MNTDHLAKLYDRLTPRERLPLLIAAGLRGDEVERERLRASAPMEQFHVADYHGLARALMKAVDLHLLTLLDLAANFWQWWGFWMIDGVRDRGAAGATDTGQRRQSRAEISQEARTEGIVRYYASRFVAHVDGWKQFCLEMHLDPEAQLDFMPGWDMITRTEPPARKLAFSPDEAAMFMRSETVAVEGDDSLERRLVSVESAEALAEVWHAILDKLAQEW
jgi:hypothetical protein